MSSNALRESTCIRHSRYTDVSPSFETTFEAPEIIVVGTQSAGKSSLIEALVGFRFNYVGKIFKLTHESFADT